MHFFLIMGKTEWAKSSTVLVFDVVDVYFDLHRFVSGLILCISECLWFGDVCGITRGQIVAFFPPPKGGLGCLMSPPCLKSQGCHLIPLYYLLSCCSAYRCYSFCLIFFSACWSILLNFSQKIFQYFSLRDTLFCMVSVQQLGEVSWSVVCAACDHMALVFFFYSFM